MVEFKTVAGERKCAVTPGSERAWKVLEALNFRRKPLAGACPEAGRMAERPDLATIRT